MVSTVNKVDTGDFHYKLFLPQACSHHKEDFDKLNLLNLSPIRIASFEPSCNLRFAYAPMVGSKVLLMSASWQKLSTLNVTLVDTKNQHSKPIPPQVFNLE